LPELAIRKDQDLLLDVELNENPIHRLIKGGS
jgi:hypothetical protein